MKQSPSVTLGGLAVKQLEGIEEFVAKRWLEKAAAVALQSTCLNGKRGSVIIKNGIVIGSGFNSPPGGLESQRRCLTDKEQLHRKVTDKTCCVHAEERAIMQALAMGQPDRLGSSVIYYAHIDKNGNIKKSGNPYCTICSKLALDAGVSEFILWHKNGIYAYRTEEYNLLSYQYKK